MNDTIDYDHEKMYDLSMLEQIADSKFVNEVIKLYLEDSPHDIREIALALASNNLDTVQKRAHKLKGSTGMLQANTLYLMLGKIETAAKSGKDKNELDSMFEVVQLEFNRLVSALQLRF